jgi:tyrosine-protein phosphatase YwqE
MFNFFKKSIPLNNIFTSEYIDIHSHILPGIDDGSKSLEMSIELLTKMKEYGVVNFVFTPHILEGLWENTPSTINKSFDKLQNIVSKSRDLSDLTMSFAAEYMLDNNFQKILKNKDILTIKDSFVLIEMSYLNPPINLFEMLFDIQMAGYKPILAHPERYNFLHNSFDEYYKLKDAGCKFQVNLLSLTNYYGKHVNKAAAKLIKNNLIDFVGSDAHHHNHLNALQKIEDKKILKNIIPLIKNNTLLK